jgi:metal-sulfur cluster biosynthetic enzyme
MSAARPAVLRIVATVVLVGVGILVMNLPALLRHGRLSTGAARWDFQDSAGPAAGVQPPDSAAVVTALAQVIDPELRLSVVELGLLDSLAVDSVGNVRVVLLLTTPECPYFAGIGSDAVSALRRLDGVRRAQVRLRPDAGWDPSQMTEEAKRRYREAFGGGSRR